MERPNRPKNQDKWRRIIQPAGDSDSSDWSSDSDLGLLLNRYRNCRPMAGHSSSSSTNERAPSPVEDVVQNDEAGVHPNSSQQLRFFKLRAQNRVAEDKDIKPLGNADVGSSTSSNSLLRHNCAERNDNEELDATSDHFWLFARKKLSFLRDRPYYLGASSDRDCGLPALPASSSSSVTATNTASTSNMSDRWGYTINLEPPPSPMRKRLFVDYVDDTNGNQPSITGSTSLQDNMPSTSSDVELPFSPHKGFCSDWLVPKKPSGHAYRRSCLSHPSDHVSQPMEDSSEIQIVSVMGGASSSSAPTHSSSGYCSAPPPVKKVRWCVPEIVHSPPQQFYERSSAANNDSNVEVINLEENVAETSSGSLKTEKENVEAEKTSDAKTSNASESCKEEQAGPSSASTAPKRNDSDELLNQGIIGLLECPVCMEYMGPPINQCRRGHLICSHCKPKLATCPTCRSRFSEQRNLAMEKVAEKLHYPCKNVHMGCAHTLRFGDREEHESNCEHRNYRCAIATPCDWRGPHQDILPHIRMEHSDSLLFGAEHELKMILGNFSEQTSQNWVVSALGELFRVNLGAVRGGRVQVFGCVIFLGPAYRASHFNYSLTVGPNVEDAAKRSLTFMRATHSYVDRCSMYYSSGDCFHLRTESAQLFCVGPCNILKVKLKIQRMEKHQ